jgi:aryl-phospho-beta-D-glucosidase BglC (GH1 family)
MIGVNLSGGEINVGSPGGYGVSYTYPSESDLDYYKSEGITLIRLPFAWERAQPTLYGALDPAEIGRIRSFLSEAHDRGMQVILDAHGFGRYDGNVVGSAAVPTSAFQDFWTKVAEQFRGNPAVYGYDIMNEPHDMGGSHVWAADAQAAVDGIRSVDPGTTIFVEGDGFSTASTWSYFNADLHVNDPSNKIVYEAHQYLDASQSGVFAQSYGQDGADPLRAVKWLQNFVDWQHENNAQGFIGEFGVPGDDPAWLPLLSNFLSAMKNYGLSGTAWGGGPWYGTAKLSLEPSAGHAAPQMAILKQYQDGSAGITLRVSVSEDAYHGDAQFTVAVDGKQMGGVYTATASHAAGQWQDIAITGAIPATPGRIDVTFINDSWGGSASADRNLYVQSITVNGQTLPGAQATGTSFDASHAGAMLASNGTLTFTPNVLHLSVSEDAYRGDAEFIVLVNGKQAGGVYTTTASHAAGQWQDIGIIGDFGPDPSRIQVQFLNDLWGESVGADRNLYVQSATIGGKTFLGAEAVDNTAENGIFDAHDAMLSLNGTVTLQPSSLHLLVSEDAYLGDAQFTVSIDGKQVGGVFTATGSHAAGQWQEIAVTTAVPAELSEIQVNFINDAWGGSPGADRNLYVRSATLNGDTILPVRGMGVPGAEAAAPSDAMMASNGTLVLRPNTLHLSVSEDAYRGDAQFTVQVDGKQMGGIYTATGSHAAGQWQDIAIAGHIGPDPHEVQVTFINDKSGSGPGADRNLYVHSATLDGQTMLGVDATDNTASLGLVDPNGAVMARNGTLTFGSSTLHLAVAEDAYLGHAQFTVAVDGKQIGGVYTATASHAAGAWQDIAITGDIGAHPGLIQVNFINDAWGGSPSTDRNLYVESLTVNNRTMLGIHADSNTAQGGYADAHEAMMAVNGTLSFVMPDAHPDAAHALSLADILPASSVAADYTHPA